MGIGKYMLVGLALMLVQGFGLAQAPDSTNAEANERYRSVLNQLERDDLLMSPRVSRLIGWSGPKANGLGDADKLNVLLEASWGWFMQTHPEWATYLGYPGQDRRWSDLSLAAQSELDALTQRTLAVAEQIDSESLDADAKLNLELFLFQLRSEVEGQQFPDELLPVDAMNGVQTSMSEVLAAMPLSKPAQVDNYLARLRGIPALLEQTTQLMQQGLSEGITPPRSTLSKVGAQLDALSATPSESNPLLRPMFEALADKPASASQLEQAQTLFAESVRPAVQAFSQFFKQEYLPNSVTETGLHALPNGEAWYAWRVREMTTLQLSQEQIHQIGLDEVARIRGEMLKVMAEDGFKGQDIAAYMRHLSKDKSQFYKDGEELLRDYRALAKQADAALPKLFMRYPALPYAVEPVPAYMAKGKAVAYYLPGSAEAARPGIFFVNTSAVDEMPRYEMPALLLHEAVPGHHFQIALAQEQGELPAFRRNAFFTAYIEGWGLYAESLGEEIGFYQTPAQRFGALTFEMWRAVRLVVDTGLHAKGWSRAQAIEYFRKQTGHSLERVTTEVDRYLVMPGQALAYKLGQLKISELRKRAESALGDAFDLRRFHDVVLAQGALPLPILESRVDAWIYQQQEKAS